jgi:hypothetical protein
MGREKRIDWRSREAEPRHFYLIEREHLRSQTFGVGMEGVLDMLRYDGARVENNAPEGYWLLSSETHPEVARWRSSGIKIILAPMCRDAFDVEEFLHQEKKAAARRATRLTRTVGAKVTDPRDG